MTKTRYVDGHRCDLKLWLSHHQPAPHEDAPPFSSLDIGNRIGRHAHKLFPGGVEVDQPPWERSAAVAETRELLENPEVPAIFEAALEHQGCHVRVDILERLDDGAWGIREVKSSTGAKEDSGHYDDVSVQHFVAEGMGLTISSVELVHVNRDYVKNEEPINWPDFFLRTDLTDVSRQRLPHVADHISRQFGVLGMELEPTVYPSRQRCFQPYPCAFWERCTADKPAHWTAALPRIKGTTLEWLHGQGIESIDRIPDDCELSAAQRRVRHCIQQGQIEIDPEIEQSLRDFGPPAYYLDFETFSPAIPIYEGTHPYQRIPFQWSLHHVGDGGEVTHSGFLSDGTSDPRRPLAENLVEAIQDDGTPIVAYNASFEKGVINNLAEEFPDLSNGLNPLTDRFVDLLPIIRDHVWHPSFYTKDSFNSSTYSIKNVLPLLIPERSHSSLDGVASGTEASRVFNEIASGEATGDQAKKYLNELDEYCELDTLAMVEIHKSLKNGLPDILG